LDNTINSVLGGMTLYQVSKSVF